MRRIHAERSTVLRDGILRRDFVETGALAGLGLSLSGGVLNLDARNVADPTADASCILLMLVGGPSQLDTWDMKPGAPADIRGPYRPIHTNIPGIEICENFPRMAKHADKYSIVRSVCHDETASHHIGQQVMQTGRSFRSGVEHPHIGCVAGKLKKTREGVPPHVLLPPPRYPGTASGAFVPGMDWTAKAREAFDLRQERETIREKYGTNPFGQNCLLARRLVEAGVRFVTIHMFQTVFDEITWDIHGAKPFSPISCYRDIVGPMFDMAYSALLEDLHQRGLLRSTMVVALGEFGRTPKINSMGGRDHWPHCWSILMGGGPLKGGTIVGASDEIGAMPKERPTTPAEVAATIYKGLGVDWAAELPRSNGSPIRLLDEGVEPIHELFS